MGHLYCEAFAIAYNNIYKVESSMKGNRIIGNLIAPHITSLITLNSFARLTLAIDDDTKNSLDPFMSLSGREFMTCIS